MNEGQKEDFQIFLLIITFLAVIIAVELIKEEE